MRAEGISHFLLGARQESSESKKVTYVTVCKVGTGYSYASLAELRSRLDGYWNSWPSSPHLPEHMENWSVVKKDDKPDVWIAPGLYLFYLFNDFFCLNFPF